MPALSTEVKSFIRRVTDELTLGQDRGARASTTIGSGANGVVTVTADAIGTAGNSYTIAVTVPGGTAALQASLSGTAITVALAVNAGVPVAASNTAVLVAAAIDALAGVSATFSGTGATSIPTFVTVKSFTGGTDTSTTSPATPSNYILAQDVSAVLDLLSQGLTKLLTATGGTTRTAVIASATANSYVGGTITFASNTTTAALRGITTRIVGVSATTITVGDVLPAAVANTDTFTIKPAAAAVALSLRDNRDIGSSPAANIYGDRRTVLDAFAIMSAQFGSGIANRTINHASLKVGTGSTTTDIVMNLPMTVDEFKGLLITISGETRKIRANDDTKIYLTKAVTSAPAATTAVTIAADRKASNAKPFSKVSFASQPADNYELASIITQVMAEVEAFTLPS